MEKEKNGVDFDVHYLNNYGKYARINVLDPKIVDPILIEYGSFIDDIGYTGVGCA